jgi:hypothetical protein
VAEEGTCDVSKTDVLLRKNVMLSLPKQLSMTFRLSLQNRLFD